MSAWLLSAVLCLCALPALAQRGLIIKPVTTSVMDPNQDGYVSQTTAGFSNDGYYVDEFEIGMHGIPIVGDGDVLNDNQVGPNCGTTDLTVDNRGFPAYSVLTSNGNLMFRFRVADDHPSVEAYTILVDTDGLIGTADPNDTPENPGFELDITLIKNSSKGVYVYDIDGISDCPQPDLQYSYDSHFQISIADVVSCGNPDYFYDFYVPFADIAALYGITTDTELRFIAVTNISATCAMKGKISDIGGVDDADYAGCNSCAFVELTSNQCPTSVANLCSACLGFAAGVTPKPDIDIPLKAGEFQITGTSFPDAEIFVDVFDSNDILKDRDTTGTVTDSTWVASLDSALEPGDSVTVRARAVGKCQSGTFSSGTSFTIVVLNAPPLLGGTTTPLTYQENDAPLRIDPSLTITDSDDEEMESAAISIVTNFSTGQDILTFSTTGGITGSFDAGTGVLTLTGTATLSTYMAVLRNVSYSNTSENPGILPRTIRFIVNDGLDNSNALQRQINVVNINDAPVSANDAATTTEDTPVTIPDITTNDSDVDGTIDKNTIDLDTGTPGIQTAFAHATGNWTVNANGDVTYSPALNFNGTASRAYTINDNQGATSLAGTIQVAVTPVNDPPTATNDSGTTNEDMAVTLAAITANDIDMDGTVNASTVDLDLALAGIQSTFGNTAGNWSVSGAGDLLYSPTTNFNGSASISYTVNDNNGATSAPATVVITVSPVNDPPIAVSDSGTTVEDTPVILANITANDTDVDGTVNPASVDLDQLTVGIQNTVSNAQGTWSADAAGAITFTPTLNFNGNVVKTYTVNDNLGATSATATITIAVTAVNDPPTVVADNGTTNEDTPVTLSNVTANDTDVDGTVNAATVDLNTASPGIQTSNSNAQGTWSANASGSITFNPTANFNGTATISYTVNDNLGATSAPGSIIILVNPVNDPPVAANDVGATNEDSPTILNTITANDTDSDGSVNAASVDLNPGVAGIQNSNTNSFGNWSVNPSGDLSYTPALNYFGTALISYVVTDNLGALSAPATVTVTVTSVNDPPVATNDTGTTFIDTPRTLFDITANDIDVDGTVDPATVDLDPAVGGIQNTFANASGLWSVNPVGDLEFTPTLSFTGNAVLAYRVSDNLGEPSADATVTINVSGVDPGNPAPVATNDNGATNEDTPVTLPNVTANDTDADGVDASTIDFNLLASGVQNSFTNTQGTWTADAAGLVTYTPALNFNGTATRSYAVNDILGATSAPANIIITVTAVNDPPDANPDNGTTSEDTPVVVNSILSNDADVDGTIDAATIDLDPGTAGSQITFTNAHGGWAVDGSGNVTYTPLLNFNGTAVLSYVVSDNLGLPSAPSSLSVTVNAVNDAPSAMDDGGSTNEATPLTLTDITANDADVDGTVDVASVDIDLSVTGIQKTFVNSAGGWSVNAAGDLTLTPAADFNGAASLLYTVADDLGATSSPANVDITVIAVNSVPVAVDDGGTTNEDVPVTMPAITANDSDSDGTIDVNSVDLDTVVPGIQNSIINSFGHWTVNASSDVTFTPALNFNGIATAAYIVNDNEGLMSGPATISIQVNAINDPPVAVDDGGASATTDEDVATTIQITTNDTDADGTVDIATVDVDLLTNGLQTTVTNAHGTWTVSGSGDVTFVPTQNFNGNASITYTVNDDQGSTSAPATIVITVNAINDVPVAAADESTTSEDGLVLVAVALNDEDIDGTLNLTSVDLDPSTPGAQSTITNGFGIWTGDGAGNVSFTPAANFNGLATANYLIADNEGGISAQTSLSILVTPVQDAPTLADITSQTNEDTPVTGSVFDPSDIDPDTTTLTVNTVPYQLPERGELVIEDDGRFTYTPGLDFNGADQAEVIICDSGSPLPPECTVKRLFFVTLPVNDAPLLDDISLSTEEDTPVSGQVLTETDRDPEGTPLLVVSAPFTPPVHGTMTINSAGTFTYTPEPGFNGADSARVRVDDSGIPLPGAFALKTIRIDVKPVNIVPEILVNGQPGDSIRVSTPEDTPILFCFESVDPDGDDVTLSSVVNLGGGGTLTLYNQIEFCFMFTPSAEFSGTSIWEIKVCDDGEPSLCGKIIAVIDVTSVNDPPVAVRDTTTVLRNVASEGNLLLNDYDPEGDGLVLQLTPDVAPSHGTVLLSEDGSYSYISDLAFRGIDSLVYVVCDTGVPTACTTATLEIKVDDLPLKVYQGLSPNGDGNNDYLRIDGVDFFPNSHLRIFDRFNNLVFEIRQYDNAERVWRGEANQGMARGVLPDGTYFYLLDVGDAAVAPMSGFVVIKKE